MMSSSAPASRYWPMMSVTSVGVPTIARSIVSRGVSATHFASVDMKSWACVDTRSSIGSRPNASQWSYSTDLVCQHVRGRPEVPFVGEPSRDPHRAEFAAAPDQQRQWPLPRRWLVGCVVDAVVVADERRAPLTQERRDHLTRLFESIEALAKRAQLDAVGGVLIQLPARADAEHQASTAEIVDGGCDVREHRGVPKRDARNERTEPQTRHGHGQCCEHRPALKRVTVERCGLIDLWREGPVRHEVVGEVHAVPPRCLAVPRQLENLFPRSPRRGPDAEPQGVR